jgi:hypothetical protein
MRHRNSLLVLCLAVTVWAGRLHAADPPAATPAPADELNEQEQAFVDLMKDCVLNGGFNIDGNEDKPVSTDRYNIQNATKVKDDSWIINARMTFGQNEIIVPVPVKMNWAGDTPVLSVTDLAIPGLGEKFSARILFYDGRYAGTWGHGEVGGLMWGKTEKPESDDDKPAQ